MNDDIDPTAAQRELLTILAEECGETTQRVTKILRFGMRRNPWKPEEHNRDSLEMELGDIMAIVGLLEDYGVVDMRRIWDHAQEKIRKMQIQDGRLTHVTVGDTQLGIPKNYRADRAELYFEAHVTIEPLFGSFLEHVKAIAQQYDFRVANLIMKKTAEETGDVARNDTFCSARGKSLGDITERTLKLCNHLNILGVRVLRYKVEDTVFDSRYGDAYSVLSG